jgi:hypothetical protein
MYMMDSNCIRVGNNGFERCLAHRIATRHGAHLQIRLSRYVRGSKITLSVRGLRWLHLLGKIIMRVWGDDHLNLDVIGHRGIQKRVARDVDA